MRQKLKENSTYILISLLIVSAFILGDILGYTLLEELPEVDKDVIDALNEDEQVRVIVTKNEDNGRTIFSATSTNLENTLTNKEIKIIRKREELNYAIAEITKEELDKLKRDRRIKNIEIDLPIKIMLDDSTDIIESKTLNNYEISGQKINGEGEVICVIDTGIDYTHSALGGCTTNEFLNGECAKVIGGINIMNESLSTIDDHGHGTHVAGIIAGDSAQITGVAPKAKLLSIKALGSNGGGYVSDLILGIEWCFNNRETYNITTISISAGGLTTYSNTCDAENTQFAQSAELVNEVITHNISIVVATGNDGRYTGTNYPACLSEAIPVTSISKTKTYATSANRGVNFQNLMTAPGVSILSANIGGGSTYKSGTSMATPHISGAIALMQQTNKILHDKPLTDAEIKELLINTSELIYDAETSKSYPLIKTLNATNKLDTTKPIIILNKTSNTIIENENTITLIWNSSSNKEYNLNLTIINPNNETILNSTDKNKELIIGTENFTLLGKHQIIINAENANGNTTVTDTFYFKKIPEFEILINGEEQNTTTYNLTHNISINKINATNVTLKINNELTNLDNTTNKTFTAGEYELLAEHPETNEHISKNKTLTLNIIDPYPEILNYTPRNLSLSLLENETIQFTHESTNPIDGELNTTWHETHTRNNITNQTTTNNETYTFNSKDKDNVTITLTVSNGLFNTTMQWNITINPTPITLINKTPQENNIILEYNETTIFSHNAHDVYNRTITNTWLLNNETIHENETYLFNATNKINTHNVSVISSNNKTTLSNTWIVQIMPEPFIEFIAPVANINDYTNKDIIITLDNYFNYYLTQNEIPQFNLTNTNIPYTRQNNKIIIRSSNEIDTTTKIITTINNETITSNEFNIKLLNEVITSSSSGGGGGGGGFAPQPPESTKNETDEEEIEDNKTIRIIQNETNNTTTNKTILIEELKIEELTTNQNTDDETDEPYERVKVIQEFQGKAYTAYKINTQTTQDNINEQNTKIEFEVKKTWIYENNLQEQDIALFRYKEEWQELPTTIKEIHENKIIYEAITPGFSYFLVGEKQKQIIREEEPADIIIQNTTTNTTQILNKENTTTKKTDGNTIFLIITIIITITLIIKTTKLIYTAREREKQKDKEEMERAVRERVKQHLKKEI
ncbi:MAG: S8 family serine peptidase [Candidatus Woesearchaeota archaeon]